MKPNIICDHCKKPIQHELTQRGIDEAIEIKIVCDHCGSWKKVK